MADNSKSHMKMLHLYVTLLFLHHSLSQDFLAKFNQDTYKLRNFRVEVESVNENIMKIVKFVTHKYNRTTAVANGTLIFKIDVEDKLEVVVQVYKKYSNEYRVFPIRFRVNARKSLSYNVGGIQGLKNCGNIEDFYFYKDVIYYFCNFAIDAKKLPPLIPTGEFKMQFRVLYNEEDAFLFSDFVEVYIPA